MIMRTLAVDFSLIEKTTKNLATQLSQTNQVEVTSPGGSNLRFSVKGREAIADTGFLTHKGDFGNLPAGEAFIAPREESTEGKLVVDGAFAGIELDKPLQMMIKRGKVINVTGGKAAKELINLLDKVQENAKVIGEFGIGTNPKAKLCPNILEAEKVLGTCHFALGNNATFGGTNQVHFHSDGLVKMPTIILDGKPLLINGVIQ
jgi:leucyl aminopeptidase (aminopeptidase T)